MIKVYDMGVREYKTPQAEFATVQILIDIGIFLKIIPTDTADENVMRYGIFCIIYTRFSVTSCDVGLEVITVLCPVIVQ